MNIMEKETKEDFAIDCAIKEAEAEFRMHEIWYDAYEILAELRQKYLKVTENQNKTSL